MRRHRYLNSQCLAICAGYGLENCTAAAAEPQNFCENNRCEQCNTGAPTLIVDLPAAVYALRHSGTPVVSRATLAAGGVSADWFGPACNPSAGRPYPFDDSPNELTLAMPRGSGRWYGRFSVAAESMLYGATVGLAEDLAIQPLALCPSCSDLPAATNPACLFVTSRSQPVSVAGERALTISTDDAREAHAIVEIARIPPAAAAAR